VTSGRVLQVVPWGGDDGVGAFAARLGEELGRRGRSVEAVAAAGGGAAGRLAVTGALTADSARSVVLHYVGYGYHSRGCPWWLLEAVERWRAGARGRLVIIFHEVYATGRSWESSFWLSPAMRWLARRLGRLADARVTSLERYTQILRGWGLSAVTLPVFSTVGEPAEIPAWCSRPPRAVVFGSAGVRARVWGRVEQLGQVCRELGIEELVDGGRGEAGAPAELRAGTTGGRPIAVRAVGSLQAEEVSALLLAARVGVLGYPAAFLAKSTVFAAYASHGVLPVLLDTGREPEVPTPPCWRPEHPADAAEELAASAFAWYRHHRLEVYAARLAELLA
jgi:hypothetical protein